MPTTNMGLVLPEEGHAEDVWDVLLNAALTRIGDHDHTVGNGTAIPTDGLLIDEDLPMAGNALTGTKTVTLTPIAAADMAAYASGLYVLTGSNDLYFHNADAADVRITAGGVLNVAALAGGIGGDYATAGALLSFDDATDRYLAQQQGSPRPWAGFAMGRLDLYEQAASITNRVRLRSPNALAASYEIVFPASPPAAGAFLQMSAAGVLTVSNTLPANQDIAVSGSGKYKHGTKTVAFGLDRASFVSDSAAAASFNHASPGTSLTASADVRFALATLPPEAIIVAIRVYCTGASGQLTASLQYFDPSSGYTTVAGATAASDAGAPRKATIVPTAPYAIGAQVPQIKITTTGTGAGTVTVCEVDFQVA